MYAFTTQNGKFDDEKTIDGTGILYDHNRFVKKEGLISTQIDDIVLFETNRKLNYKERIIAVYRTLLIGLDLALGVVCIIDLKYVLVHVQHFILTKQKMCISLMQKDSQVLFYLGKNI